MNSEESFIHAQFKLPRRQFDLDVDLKIPAKGVTAVFGQSGSGKTSLLRCIAGLEPNAIGQLSINNNVWQSHDSFLPTHKRSIGYVFQDASLFTHLSVTENLNYGIKRAKRKSDSSAYDHIINLLGIEHILNSMPENLSGGEMQRVAIARALLINPDVLLLDEPLSSLDQARKQEILPYLEKLKAELNLPILYVSHSPNEIARLADHIVALDQGKVVANGPLIETMSSLSFPIQLGEDTGVVLDAEVLEINTDWHLAKVAFAGGELWVRDGGFPEGENVRVRILARDISLAHTHHNDSSIVNLLLGEVEEISDDVHPAMALIKLRIKQSILIARITRRSANYLDLKVGGEIWAQIKSAALIR